MGRVRASETHRPRGVTVSIIVHESEPLREVSAKLASNPAVRGIFVVDSRGKFTGLISSVKLMKWVHLELFGGKGRKAITIGEVFSLIYASKAKDLLRRDLSSISLKETDTFQSALDKMIEYEEDVIPVLDKDGTIIGDLTLNEVLSALQAEEYPYSPEDTRKEDGRQYRITKRCIPIQSYLRRPMNDATVCYSNHR